MTVLFSLNEIAESIENRTSDVVHYLDMQTGVIEMVIPEDYRDESDDIAERIEAEPSRYIALPEQYEAHEYRMMENFIDTVQSENVQDKLWEAISKRGAYRRFKDAVSRYRLLDDWYAFRTQAYIDFARDWCEENNVPLK